MKPWIWNSDEILSPADLLAEAQLVKANPVRAVYRSGDFFLKQDRRRGSRLRAEWNSAQLLKQHGIPTVEHIGCGPWDGGELLITRNWPDSQPVDEFFYREFELADADPSDFLCAFADFVKTLLDGKLFHPDFHLGNILYSRSQKSFALVDVRGVNRRHWWHSMYRMERVLLEFRERLDDAEQLMLLTRAGIPAPEYFWTQGLQKEAVSLRREWPRRQVQILQGYPKFTISEADDLLVVDPTRQVPMDSAMVEEPGSREILLAHFFLQLGRIPHRQVRRWRSREQRIIFAETRLRENEIDAEAFLAFSRRLSALDIQVEPADCRVDHRGRLLLWNLQRVEPVLKEL